jgi:hypothetical protein
VRTVIVIIEMITHTRSRDIHGSFSRLPLPEPVVPVDGVLREEILTVGVCWLINPQQK